MGNTIFTSPNEDGAAFYVVIRATQKSSRLKGEGSTSICQFFLSPFKTLTIGPASVIDGHDIRLYRHKGPY